MAIDRIVPSERNNTYTPPEVSRRTVEELFNTAFNDDQKKALLAMFSGGSAAPEPTDGIEHIEVKLFTGTNEETGAPMWLNPYTGAELLSLLNDPTKILDVYIRPEGSHNGRIARAVSYNIALNDFGAPLGFSFIVCSKGDGMATFVVIEYYVPNDSTDYEVLRTLKFDKNLLYE